MCHCSLSQHLMSPEPEEAPSTGHRAPYYTASGQVWFSSCIMCMFSEGFRKDPALPAPPRNLISYSALGCNLTMVSLIHSKPVNPLQNQNSSFGACSRHLLLLKLLQKQVEGRRLPLGPNNRPHFSVQESRVTTVLWS